MSTRCTVVHLCLGLTDPGAVVGPRFELVSRALAKHAPDGAPLPVPAAPFDVVLEIRLPGEEPRWGPATAAAVRDAAARAPGVDPARSVVVAGTELTVVPGTGTAFSAGLVRRRRDLDRESFVRHWRDRHALLARRVAGATGYRQLHAVPEFSAAVAAELGVPDAGFDGTGLLLVADAAALAGVRAAPEVARDATEDEMRFLDHSRSFFVAARQTGDIVPTNVR